MKIRNFAIAAGVLALGLAAWNTPSRAQGPMYDRVNVDLPYSVTIGDRTLQPGQYVIQQLRNLNNSRVLLIYSDNGMKFETTAITIPALDTKTPEDTKVVLHHFGPDYYFDKIWIQGKNYGYEFPLPDSVKNRERERLEPISVAANYSTVPAEDTSAAATQSTTTAATNQSTTTAATNTATTTAATNQATTAQSAANSGMTTTAQSAANQRMTSPQAAGSAATTQSTMGPSATTNNSTMAQNTVPPATTTPSTMPPSTTRSSDMSGSADRSMPATSAGWLMMLLSGGALSGAGMALRRKR
jgi:hypothetical protein